MEYNVSDGQDEKSGCRVLFTGQGINSWVIDFDQIKKKYRTAHGILSYIMNWMERWNLRHGNVQYKTS